MEFFRRKRVFKFWYWTIWGARGHENYDVGICLEPLGPHRYCRRYLHELLDKTKSRERKRLGFFLSSLFLLFLFPRDGKLFSEGQKKLPYVTSCNVKLIIEIYNRAQTIYQRNENRNVLWNFISFYLATPSANFKLEIVFILCNRRYSRLSFGRPQLYKTKTMPFTHSVCCYD